MSKNPHKNKLKTAVAITLVVSFVTMAAIIAVATFKGDDDAASSNQQTVATESASVDAPVTPDPLSVPASQQTTTPSNSPATSPTPTPTPTPTPAQAAPAIACGTKNGACTKAQVAVHNKQTDCWVIYKNSYYIVTEYAAKHPGGKQMFNSQTCGADIEPYLNGSASSSGESNKHGSSAYSDLEKLKVGPVTSN